MSASTPAAVPRATAAGRFGTFGGVFTPSILTILGVVMYLRLGWVTGEAGLGGTILIVLIAHAISYATGLSVASIATNRTVGAGGAYFMISRSLGASAGAAIGIPLFFAQALSVTFYIVGFTEAVVPLIPEEWRDFFDPLFISTSVNVLLTMLSLKSADLAIKAQYFVMAAIVLSLVSFGTGTTNEFPREIEWFNEEGEGFGTIFAVFFPAVTGIMAGVSMSGDLKDPRVAIPKGTLWAITVGMIVYLVFPIWLSLNYSNGALANDMSAVWTISRWPELIYVGVWGATLSSALGSILTAPRTLQALALDGLVPRVLGRGSGPSQEPRIGIILTFVLSQTGIFLGSLDAIAPVLTMFFLATYGVTNLACGLQKWAGNPSFRPSFAVPSFISLGGGAACFYVMSIIDLPAMVAALVFCGLIFFIASRRALGTTYGDARHGIWSAIVRYALQRLRRAEYHPLNWRPNLLILGGNPNKRPHLLHLGNAIVQDRGIVTYFHLLRGLVKEKAELRRELFETYEARMAVKWPNVFYRVDIVDDVFEGAVQVAQSYGVGSFECNAVMAGWPLKPERAEAYAQMLRDLTHLDRSLLLVKWDEERQLGDGREIHVWWGGLQGNGGLMLLLAFLLTAHYRWRRAKVVVLTVVNDEASRERAEANLTRTLQAARLDAEPRVLLREGRKIPEIMGGESAEADLAIVGFRLPPEGQAPGAFFERMSQLMEGLPTTILVHSARSFESEPVLFDDGHETEPEPLQVGDAAPSVPPVAARPSVPDAAKISSPGQLPAGAPLPPSDHEGRPSFTDLPSGSTTLRESGEFDLTASGEHPVGMHLASQPPEPPPGEGVGEGEGEGREPPTDTAETPLPEERSSVDAALDGPPPVGTPVGEGGEDRP
ncbi:MAG TPA: hypothetical protein RMH26_13100, partial [Polyangiaceae bacterium LLY-WYZ-15_(1-7)]|nr:hypothetical protein [Polyangiaceae bacterium LLY-WYZ-15_(1-7)]